VTIPTGIPALDEVLQGLRLGDNVVWQVDDLDDYLHLVRPFAERAMADGRKCVYIRFAPPRACAGAQRRTVDRNTSVPAQTVRVIDIPAACDGAHAHVVADPRARKAVCDLE